jgi:hypothetical protein
VAFFEDLHRIKILLGSSSVFFELSSNTIFSITISFIGTCCSLFLLFLLGK